MKIHGIGPLPGNIYVVINMTIENLADNGAYSFNEKTIRITGGGPITQKMYTSLTNPMYWGPVPPGDERTGEVVFGVKESTQSFALTFLDTSGKDILTQEIGTIPVVDHYPSQLDPALLASENFSYVVENLDTPAKAAQYTQEKFIFEDHGKCTSYTPEEFLKVKKGDCKDYATFLSYILAKHGYDAKIVAFKYFVSGARKGHVVTLFTDTDGKMKYATTPDVTIFREVTSVEDLLAKECVRLEVPSIANYVVLPAGSTDTCVE